MEGDELQNDPSVGHLTAGWLYPAAEERIHPHRQTPKRWLQSSRLGVPQRCRSSTAQPDRIALANAKQTDVWLCLWAASYLEAYRIVKSGELFKISISPRRWMKIQMETLETCCRNLLHRKSDVPSEKKISRFFSQASFSMSWNISHQIPPITLPTLEKCYEQQISPVRASDFSQTKGLCMWTMSNTTTKSLVVYSRLFANFISLRLCLVFYVCLHKGVSGFDAPVSCIVLRTQANTAGHLIDS